MLSFFTNKFTNTALVFRKLWFVDCNSELTIKLHSYADTFRIHQLSGIEK